MGRDKLTPFMNPTNAGWKSHKKIFQDHLGPSTLPRLHPLILKNVHIFLKRLLDTPTDFSQHIKLYVQCIAPETMFRLPNHRSQVDGLSAVGGDVWLRSLIIRGSCYPGYESVNITGWCQVASWSYRGESFAPTRMVDDSDESSFYRHQERYGRDQGARSPSKEYTI